MLGVVRRINHITDDHDTNFVRYFYHKVREGSEQHYSTEIALVRIRLVIIILGTVQIRINHVRIQGGDYLLIRYV